MNERFVCLSVVRSRRTLSKSTEMEMEMDDAHSAKATQENTENVQLDANRIHSPTDEQLSLLKHVNSVNTRRSSIMSSCSSVRQSIVGGGSKAVKVLRVWNVYS